MKFGGNTLTFTDFVATGTPDEDGNLDYNEITYIAQWCRHRPMSFQETVDANLDVTTEWWKSTIPVHEYDDVLRAAVMAAKPDSVIDVDGQEYQIHGGPRTHPDMGGTPFKTTIISKKQIG